MKQNEKRSSAWRYLVVLAVYLALVTVFSHMQSPARIVSNLSWDKLLHFVEYLPVGFLLTAWYCHNSRGYTLKRVILGSLAAVLIIGLLDEFHQYFIPTRDCSVFDVTADILGGLTGSIIAVRLYRKKRIKEPG